VNPKESHVQAAICDYLALRKHFFWRSNNTPIFDTGGAAIPCHAKYTMKALPDIIVIKSSAFIGLEMKTLTGRLSADQIRSDGRRRKPGLSTTSRTIDIGRPALGP